MRTPSSEGPIAFGRVNVYGRVMTLALAQYRDGHPAIVGTSIAEEGFEEPYDMLSVNLGHTFAPLEPWEVWVKDYSDNVSMAEAALETGLFEETDKNEPSGHVLIPIWRLKAESLDAAVRDLIAARMAWPVPNETNVDRANAPDLNLDRQRISG
jgi:hypothetical protein